MNALPDAGRARLEAEFDSGFLRTEASELETYGRDWTKVHTPDPSAVVFPRSTEEVARFMALAHREGWAVVPSGGRTGLAGGAVACRGEVVLSTDRIRQLGEVDSVAQVVEVGAGAVTAAVHEHTGALGLTWPVEMASAGSSHIGGNISTNAGGIRVVRYGLTRNWVLGLDVVTAEGEVLRLNGALEKNNTGIDLRQLFIGSEGTLGVITGATLKLTSVPGPTRVAVLAVGGLADALRLFRSAREAKGFDLMAFEFLTERCVEIVESHGAAQSPFEQRSPAYVLVELEDVGEGDGADAWLEHVFGRGLVSDGVLAESGKQSRELWALRENISESLSKAGFLHKNDVSLPVSRLPDFVSELEEVLARRYPDFGVYLFGHVGDGNVHINIMKPEAWSKEDFLAACNQTDEVLFEQVKAYAGSISAEHGIGLLKKPFLGFSRTPAELELFRRIKRSLDPRGLLNPGKVFDEATP
ncbi:MAG: FAD-binding oxidoreductase [Myxococcota bacterium]